MKNIKAAGIILGATFMLPVFVHSSDFIVKTTTEVPKIDGKLDEAVWKNAKEIVEGNLTIKGCCDDKNLYIGITSKEEDTKKLVAKVNKSDDPAISKEDDYIEFVLALPKKEETQVFERVLINKNSIKYDVLQEIKEDIKKPNNDINWNVEAKSSIGNELWNVEIALPITKSGQIIVRRDGPNAANQTKPTWHKLGVESEVKTNITENEFKYHGQEEIEKLANEKLKDPEFLKRIIAKLEEMEKQMNEQMEQQMEYMQNYQGSYRMTEEQKEQQRKYQESSKWRIGIEREMIESKSYSEFLGKVRSKCGEKAIEEIALYGYGYGGGSYNLLWKDLTDEQYRKVRDSVIKSHAFSEAHQGQMLSGFLSEVDVHGDYGKPNIVSGNTVWLGVATKELTAKEKKDNNLEKGVLITKVEKGSPAEKSELKEGDIIVKIEDKEIVSHEFLRKVIADYAAGSSVYVEIIREKKRMKILVTLESR